MYEDEDNDGRFPDESPVEVRYPAASRGAEEQSDREERPWLPGTILEQCGPDEWYVCVEVRELAVLRDGRRAPRGTASRNLYYPCCFRDRSEVRSRTASSGAALATRPGAGGNRDRARRRFPGSLCPLVADLRLFPRRPGGADHDGMTAIATSYELLLKVGKGAVGIVDVPEFGFVA